ncbi:ras-like GTP-binding protein Rho1 [Folsomia candida]|uniref:Ras-like GTP-binding protein Rho1 n=1 Tax=Folsomia candida TaxID=158441 RepID=A0A226E394_FOLCA|nr:ras-like GTP-binding protein Rho1 [Folsomia candida]OXA52053.1 Ras-like GTP-binding protein Rho1 [Folsomia candida]
MSTSIMAKKKLVIVGDGACGKTSLLITFSKDSFPTMYVPTVFENYVTEIEIDGKVIDLALWDTAGQEDYDRLRPLSYPDTDVLLICFSVDNPDSLQNVMEKWGPECSHFCPDVPIVLCGNKIDLRDDPMLVETLALINHTPVGFEVGQEVASKINAVAYVECSALTREGVHNVFETSVRACMKQKKQSWISRCMIA